MTGILRGPINMSMSRDREGYKDYSLTWLIETTSYLDGPWTVINCPGLPDVGTEWTLGNDSDLWVWCTPEAKITPLFGGSDQDTVHFWTLEQTFTNRPFNRCQDEEIEEPWLEPARVSGSFVKYTREVRFDRNGKLIKSSSHEPITGPDVEFDHNKPTVSIEISSLTLPLALFAGMVDTVNDANLWGLSPRMIKLSNVYWRRHLYGLCTYYYVIGYEFDVDFETFDRKVLDVGTRHINPEILKLDDPNSPGNKYTADSLIPAWTFPDGREITFPTPIPLHKIPAAFTKIVDARKNPMGFMILNGKGQMWAGPDSGEDPGEIDIEYYPESDFLLLGIPTVLGS